MARLVRGLLVLAGAVLLVSCVGPEKENSLVTSDWRTRIDRPIVLDPDWVYQGERFEQVYRPEEEQ
ncbi:hypothetical protein ACFL59_09530 [Planctomycetota bacterium]